MAKDKYTTTDILGKKIEITDYQAALTQAKALASYEAGKEIPNENLAHLLVNNLKIIDSITTLLSDTVDELRILHGTMKELTQEGDEVLENAISHLDNCQSEIHKFTDPEDKIGLFKQDK